MGCVRTGEQSHIKVKMCDATLKFSSSIALFCASLRTITLLLSWLADHLAASCGRKCPCWLEEIYAVEGKVFMEFGNVTSSSNITKEVLMKLMKSDDDELTQTKF